MAPKRREVIKSLMFQDVVMYISGALHFEPKVVKGVIEELTLLAAKEVAKAEKFVIPDLVMLKLVRKPATRACKRMMFGKERDVKAKPKKKVVKCKVSAAVGRFVRGAGAGGGGIILLSSDSD